MFCPSLEVLLPPIAPSANAALVRDTTVKKASIAV